MVSALVIAVVLTPGSTHVACMHVNIKFVSDLSVAQCSIHVHVGRYIYLV